MRWKPDQEQLLAGKYKNAQELEKAYMELQSKLGSGEEAEPTDEQAGDQIYIFFK